MKNKHLVRLVQGAMIAALYVVINYSQEMLFPTSTSMTVQFRLAEILCIFACFIPSAIWGLTLGTLLSNIVSAGTLPLDWAMGALATFLAALCMYALRNVKVFDLPVLSSFMPVIFNAIIIGLELEIFIIGDGFHLGSFLVQAGFVALGEFVVCVVLGLPFSKLVKRMKIFSEPKA